LGFVKTGNGKTFFNLVDDKGGKSASEANYNICNPNLTVIPAILVVLIYFGAQQIEV
jgi:hypothetical protein